MKKIELNYKLVTRRVFLVAYDIIAVCCSNFLALLLRYELRLDDIPDYYMDAVWEHLPVSILITLLLYYFFRLYHSLWAYAGVSEMQNIIVASFASAALQGVTLLLFNRDVPKSYYFFNAFLLVAATMMSRFAYRFAREKRRKRHNKNNGISVMIVGAGDAGNTIIKEINSSYFSTMRIRAIIDDDPHKQGRFIQGIKVVGGRDKIVENAALLGIDEIIIAIPSAGRRTIKEIVEIAGQTNCKLRTLPGMYQLVNGEVDVSKLRDVDVEDLLGREPIKVDLDSILGYVKDKTVLVTGGGGSIGSELCRQIAKAGPKRLIIFDIYENNAYEIQQELKRAYKSLDIVVLIGSVRNNSRINWVMDTYKPDIVYHAAAHKHVPLMEESPNEAIKNNVIGTYKTAKAAARIGVRKFVFISTDKAVNPTNIMGASKRLCEMVIQMMDRKCDSTDFVAVRFGNVLGSNGSVIPLFKKQIAEGGPVTVTDKDIIRYFMTIPEAVSLVLQASYYAKGGEIFILDMGEPVRIDDMARNLIRLSGYTPDVDIPIVYTGLRPGEKLYEELLMSEEGMQDTENELIHIGHPIDMDDEWFEKKLELLDDLSSHEADEIKKTVAEIVPTYQYKGK